MNVNYNYMFMDCIDKINKIAQSKGWTNGITWANYAAKHSLITEGIRIEYDNCHALRVSMSHGNMKNIVVHQDTYSNAQKFLKIIESKIQYNNNPQYKKNNTHSKNNNQNTVNNHEQSNSKDKKKNLARHGRSNYSEMEIDFVKKLLYDIYMISDYDDNFGDIANSLYYSDEPFYKNKRLLRVIKNGLYKKKQRLKHDRYYGVNSYEYEETVRLLDSLDPFTQ